MADTMHITESNIRFIVSRENIRKLRKISKKDQNARDLVNLLKRISNPRIPLNTRLVLLLQVAEVFYHIRGMYELSDIEELVRIEEEQ